MSEDTYLAIRELIIEYADAGLAHGEIYEKLEANHGELLDRYMRARRRELMHAAIWTVVGQSNRNRRRRAVFGEVAERVEAGESLLLTNLPSADGKRKTLVEMTKEDLIYSAELDEQFAQGLIDTATVKRAIARRVPKGKTVGDVFTPEKIVEFMNRLGLEAAA